MPTTKSTLRLLATLISDAVDQIESDYSSAGLEFPSLDDPFDPTQASNNLLFSSKISQQAAIIVGAAEQLSVTVRPPQNVIFETAFGFHKSSCLRAASTGCVAEILREGGPQGVPVEDVASKNGMDADKLSRILRLLATHNIFRETSPNVFANNRPSSILATSQPTSKLFNDRIGKGSEPNPLNSSGAVKGAETNSGIIFGHKSGKYTGSNGVAALVEFSADETMKASAFMTDNLFDPDTRSANDMNNTPFNKAWNTKLSLFDWLHTDKQRAARFDYAIKGVELPGALFGEGCFPWESLSPGSKLVDVGGGIGSISLPIATKFPGLKVVVQDLPTIISHADTFWEDKLPGSVETGRVILQGHDFFTPQPVTDADLWILRTVLHNWPTSHAVKILQRLREASVMGKSRLLIIEPVVGYACTGTPSGIEEIEGVIGPAAPTPLVANFGRASSTSYLLDLQMLVVFHSQERTIGDHVRVTEAAGWKITRLYRPAGSLYCHILAEAV